MLGRLRPSSENSPDLFVGSVNKEDAIAKYRKTGETPEFTIQGVMDDTTSDYYKKNGADTCTCVGCVLTGDLNLIDLDSGGEVVDDVINFNAKDIV